MSSMSTGCLASDLTSNLIMESRIKAARNWAKVKDLLIVKKNTQPKLAPISPFIRRTIR